MEKAIDGGRKSFAKPMRYLTSAFVLFGKRILFTRAGKQHAPPEMVS